MTHCNTSLGLPRANAPAVPSVFRNTPPADAQDESLRTAPEDWRAQSAEQKAAINQFHIARIAEHFRQTGARVKQHAEDLPLDPRLANYIIEGTRDGLVADLDRKWAEGAAPLEIINGPPAGGAPMHTFRFGRQRREDGLCLSDYVLEGDLEGDNAERDHLALLVVTAGSGIREKSEEWKKAGAFFKAHAIQALAIETAEATSEWLHRRIREDWGFPDAPTVTMHDRFTSKYHGKRYSFGYPACPNLDDQQGLWKLLQPGDIGVQLTEGMMMEPEASVSALVFHHLDCAYFTAEE